MNGNNYVRKRVVIISFRDIRGVSKDDRHKDQSWYEMSWNNVAQTFIRLLNFKSRSYLEYHTKFAGEKSGSCTHVKYSFQDG